MKPIVYLIVLAFCLTGCKKKFYTEVEGQVLDDYTFKPVSDCKVFLIGSNAGLSGSPSFNVSQEVITGSDGKFKFTFKRNEFDHYYLRAKPIDDYKYFFTNSSNDYTQNEVKFSRTFRKELIYKNLLMQHCGYVKVNYIKLSTDTITYIYSGYSYSNAPQLNPMFTSYGTVFNGFKPVFNSTTYVFCVRGNLNIDFSLNSNKLDNIGAETTDTFIVKQFYITPHDTIYYQFNY